MIIYCSLFLYWFFLTSGRFVSKKQSLFKQFLLVTLPILLIMSLRSIDVGCDLFRYKNRFDDSYFYFYEHEYEKGFSAFNFFINNILHFNWQWYLVIVSLITISSLFCFFSLSKQDKVLSFFIYASIGLFAFSLSGIRQMLAISICYFALFLFFKINKKFFKLTIFIGLVFAAYFVHNSAIVFLIVLPLSLIRLNKTGAIVLLAISVLSILLRQQILLLIFKIIPAKYLGLADLEDYKMNMLDFAVTLSIPLFCVVFSKTEKKGKYNRFFSLMFIFACLNVAFTGFSLSNNQFGRIAFYFTNSYAVLIPFTLSCFRKEDRSLLTILICLLCVAYFLIGNHDGTYQIDNYRFFWG